MKNLLDKITNAFEDIKKLLDDWFQGGLSDLNFQKFYKYLDSLTLLQESSLLHIIMFIVIFTTVFNILGVLLGNEMVRYFNLEERFPLPSNRGGFYFKLRTKFQRYYLIWNVFILFIICIVGVGINILLFVV
uniref:LAGLIDADG endonuclease n=1 Tax=Poriella subacida TaxID=2872513 RepID=UPI0030013748|nr:LAGLIDADG endonuclease [Poriella subacida]